MFNSYSHYSEEFLAINVLSQADREIYKAREAQYRSRYIWSGELEQVWSNCLIHMSPNVPGKVAYFSSLENLRANKTTRTSPQMFLERYLADAPEFIKAVWQAEVLGKTLPEVKFALNTEPDKWQLVYENGPPSCMKGNDLVRNYAHPKNNLALAYYEKPSGAIMNRTIVNQKTKAYARIYGDDSAMFAAALRKLGYYHSGNETLVGEIIYVGIDTCTVCGDSILVGPYLDCEESFVKHTYERETHESQGKIGCERGDRLYYDSNDDRNYRCEQCS